MDLDWTPADLQFRQEVREWLHAHKPSERRPSATGEAAAFDRAWQRTQFDGGWAGINWPVEYGGRGLGLIQQLIWHEEHAMAGAPAPGAMFVAVNHAGPTLIACGTDAQKQAHLKAILTGESLWCQGFSEPSAGSDLAALRTRAVIDGEDLVVTGQKIWTSFAQVAQQQELLVRTGEPGGRHRGLTWVICDMATPGIEIQPIRKMTGENDFATVFYDSARIPLANVVGGVDRGWATAMATLGFERGTTFVADAMKMTVALEKLIDHARDHPLPGSSRAALHDDAIVEKIAAVRAELAGLRALNYANLSRYAKGTQPGAESSITKLMTTECAKHLYDLANEILGHQLFDLHGAHAHWAYDFQKAIINAIGGGTTDIQREVVADRVLELPRSR